MSPLFCNIGKNLVVWLHFEDKGCKTGRNLVFGRARNQLVQEKIVKNVLFASFDRMANLN